MPSLVAIGRFVRLLRLFMFISLPKAGPCFIPRIELRNERGNNIILLAHQQSASNLLYCTPNITSNTLLILPMTACSSSHTRKKALYIAVEPAAKFMTYQRSLTPDAAVGLSQKVQERGPTVHLPLQ